MLTSFFETLQSQLQNQVVAGGVALALAGILITALRKVPGLLWSQLQRLVIVTAVIDSRNDIFNAYVNWLNNFAVWAKESFVHCCASAVGCGRNSRKSRPRRLAATLV